MTEEPDKGRAWLFAVAALILHMITAGIFRIQGLLFVQFINVYHSDRKGASLPFSVRTAMGHLLAPIAGILGQKFGARSIIIAGGILGTISSALSFFASDMLWMVVTWGVFNGTAMAATTVLPQIVISQYFIKHRTTATGISLSGGGLSSLVFPAIFEILLYTYGLDGIFLILAGIIMNSIPAAMILKTPSWLKEANGKGMKSCGLTRVEGNDRIVPGSNTYNKPSDIRQCDRGIQVGNDKICDISMEKKVIRDTECRHNTIPRSRSYNGLTSQMHLYNMQRTSLFPRSSSIGQNYKTISSNPENVFDVNMDYLKQKSDLVFHMLSMEIPNVEISYRAILLEVEQDDLWHPDENEIMQEIENMYSHTQKFLEFDEISSKSTRPNGMYLKKALLSGTLTISKKSGSLRAVKRYLKTYKARGLQQLGKIRSAPNMSNIYNEIARRDYVISKLKQLCNSNEIRIISHLCKYNPKDVLKVLFQVRNLYKMYNDLECCDQCESSEFSSPTETGDMLSHRKDSCLKANEVCSEKESTKRDNSFKFHIKTALNVHTNAIFLLIYLTRTVFFLSYSPVMTTMVDFAMDRGLQEDDGKFVIGAFSLGDLFGRSCLGWITDRGYATLPKYMLVSMILLSVCMASIPLMYSRWTILSSIAILGMLGGSMFIRFTVLVTKYLKSNEHSIAVGCLDFSSGVISLLIPLYIGYFRDTIGSYDGMYYINGILVLLTGLGWLFESRLVHRENIAEKNSKE